MAKQDVIVQLRYGGQWNTHTSDVLVRDGITITVGKADEFGQAPPAMATLTFNGHDYNPNNPSSSLYGSIGRNTPIIIWFSDNTDIRFIGEISKWTPRQSLGGANVPPHEWVYVEASGVLRRLGQGADPLEDAVRRFVAANRSQCIGYWPMDDVDGSRHLSAVVGGAMKNISGLLLGGAQLAPWLPLGVQTQSDGNAVTAGLVGGTPGGFAADLLYRATLPLNDSTDTPIQLLVGVITTNSGYAISTNPSSGDIAVQVLGDDLTLLALESGTVEYQEGRLHHFRLRVTDGTGDNANVFVDVDGVNVIAVAVDIGSSTPGTPSAAHVIWSAGTSAGKTLPIRFGHLAVWKETVPGLTDSVTAYFGHQGETAGDRLDRLCDEQGVGFVAELADNDDLDDTVPVGAQHADGFVKLLQEATEVDRGLLIDGQTLVGESLGLRYRTHRSLYNQTAALELDYDDGDIAPPLEPVIDDRGVRNDVTVTRRDGGQARAVDQTSVDAIGRITDARTVNVMGDTMVGDQAGWLLHLGTVDETRYPKITVDLDASPGLLAAVADLSLGDRITIDNLPATISPDLASLIVLGWTEVIGSHRRKITFNCVPESAYHIGEVESDDYGFIDGDPAWQFVTTGTFTSGTSTSLGVAFDSPAAGSGGLNWSGADVPIDIRVAGVVLHVTAVSGTVSPHIFTVDQTPLNGVVKAIPSGSVVELASPAYIGL